MHTLQLGGCYLLTDRGIAAAVKVSGDATPCRMSGFTLHSHVRYKKIQTRSTCGPCLHRCRVNLGRQYTSGI